LFYCTAKPGLVCGTPAISTFGAPSAAATSGFVILAGPARSNRSGILLYTDQGAGAAPFSGGTLCLAPPVRRTPASLETTGTGGCDGVLSIDMNAFAAGALGGNPIPSLSIPGTLIDCQFWGRDTLANGALLTDALEYFVGW
jgi:hypothetical protein